MSMDLSSADDKDKTEPETAVEDDKRNMAPASDTTINDDDDDKTEPVPEQLTRTSSGEPDAKCEDDNAREPADLSTKSKKEVLPVQRPFRLDPEDVARFSRDPVEWMKTFRVPVDQKSREPDDKGHLKPVDYTTTLNNNNNNIVQQLLGQQLLGNRNAIDDSDAVTQKKKRSRSKKRRSGSDVTASDPATTGGMVATSGGVVTQAGGALAAGLVSPSSGVAADPNSPPVVLDVVCGQNQASLSLEKLKSGSKTACVQLNGSWLTPNQYQHVSGRGTARDWKRSIKHNGTSLKALLASKVLTFDPPLCRCNLCHAISTSSTSSSSHAKETSSGAIAARSSETTRVDQENEPPSPPPPSLPPPRGVDRPPSATAMAVASGGARSPYSLARTSKEPTPTIVCDGRDSTDDEEQEEEEDEEEEEEEAEETLEEEEVMEEVEEDVEEEDWEKKRVLMDGLSLKQLPTTTWRIRRRSSTDGAKPSRKRKAPLQRQDDGGGCRAKRKKVRRSPDGRKEKRGSGGGGSGGLSPHLGGKSNRGSEKVRRNSENDAVGGASSLGSSDWTTLDTSGPSDLCRVLSASTGATSSLETEAFNAMQQRVNGEYGTPSLQKEETLTHIIHELRNYKKSLEEKIVASRRTSHVTPSKEPTSASGPHNPHLQWSSAGGGCKDGLPPTFQRCTSTCSDKAKSLDAARTSASQDGCVRRDWSVKGATKLVGSDEKQLPDLVRSHNPSTITTTTSSPAGSFATTTPKTPCSIYPSFTPSPLTSTPHYSNNPVGRYVVDPQTGAKYDCDEQGVIDLSIGKKHATASNLAARPIYSTLMGKMEFDGDADSDCERVLDLSVTSKVKAEYRTTPRAAAPSEEQRVQKRKRLSDGHSRRGSTSAAAAAASVHKHRPPPPPPHPTSSSPWTVSPGKILGWTVTDVAKFVADVPECGIYAETFKQFGVTGPSLVCLSVDQMTAILRMRLNAAQSLRSAIDRIVAAAAAVASA